MNGQLNINKEQIEIINKKIKSEDSEKIPSKIIINNQINQINNSKDKIYFIPLPAYKNLLDNYDIIQYKNIIIPRIKFDNNNEYNLDYYKKTFNDFLKKIDKDNNFTQDFIKSISNLPNNKNGPIKNNKYEKLTFDNEIRNQSFSILSKNKNNINYNSNISDNEINNIFSFGDNKNNITDTALNDDSFFHNTFYEINEQSENDIAKKSNYKRGIFNVQLFDENKNLIHKKRGRIPIKNEVTHVHSALDDDNILRKIQVHFLSFLVSFTNDYINTILPNVDKNKILYFKHIDYKYKKTINHESIEKIKTLKIGEILQLEISQKYKTCNKNINQIIYNNICELCPYLKYKYFNILFKDFFIEYYYNKNEGFISVNGIKVNLSIKTKAFNSLIQKNTQYSQKFREIATYFYLNNINGNGNSINNKDDENAENQKGIIKKTFFLIE